MKVSEILNESRVKKDPSASAKTNSTYAPAYLDKEKVLVGSAKDWMMKYGFSDSDIKQAMSRVKDAAIIKSIEQSGFILKPSKARADQGTLYFVNGVHAYLVHANGQIRGGRTDNMYRDGVLTTYKVTSPKPKFDVNSKDKIADLTINYTKALEQLKKTIDLKLK
jgi:hypothetical protein